MQIEWFDCDNTRGQINAFKWGNELATFMILVQYKYTLALMPDFCTSGGGLTPVIVCLSTITFVNALPYLCNNFRAKYKVYTLSA